MASHACELLKAMANEWRLIILCQLSEGEKTVSELQGILGLSQSALSQHLAVLRREKIVSARKDAQSVSGRRRGNQGHGNPARLVLRGPEGVATQLGRMNQ
jgi:DNA-binding transcriptional ArsR family regulator